MSIERWDWVEKMIQTENEIPTEISPSVFQTSGFIFFWRNAAIYSQWHNAGFEVDGVHYNCAEQYMMAGKAKLFEDTDILKKIMETNNPGKQKKLGRKVAGFDATTWNQNCQDIVLRACIAKFNQNAAFKEELLATGDRIIVEASPNDKIWGIGMTHEDPNAQKPWKWKGTNLLGKCLMQARENIRNGAHNETTNMTENISRTKRKKRAKRADKQKQLKRKN